MPPDIQIANLTLHIDAGEDADAEELDQLARQLLGEIQELEVESVELAGGGTVSEGAKSAEAATLGVLAVAVLPTVLPALITFLQTWSLRGQNRTVKIKTQEEDDIPTNTPIPSPTSLPQTITATDGVTMVLVPGGPFTMGSESGKDDEKPVHTVTLDDFYIDQYEVTNAQYASCVAADACDSPFKTNSRTRDSYFGNPEYDGYPVIYVDWNQAKTYCEWRRDRLPTEAEWEKAARGTVGQLYPWGDDFDGRQLNFCDSNCQFTWSDNRYDDGYADTAPIGSYFNGVSPYGVYDMAGNVWEWVQSEYRDYPYQADDGREDLNSTNVRVLRGGSWDDGGSLVRAADRFNGSPAGSNANVRFRCAR